MKKKISFISLVAGLIMFVSSCDDVFDVERVGTITPEQMWGSADLITDYVNSFYTILPAWDRMDLISAESNMNTKATVTFLKGKLTSTDWYPAEMWDYAYVRRLNEFFENIKTAAAVFDTGEKERLMGQAYFFRAYIYYRMLQSFGGVPIITNVQNPAAELSTLYVKRATSLETFDFVSGQLDSAILNLPAKGTSGYGAERITKAAAMAMKGKLLLLKASPLFCKTSNSQYWTDAYNTLLAARNELDAEGYGMYQDGTKWATDNILYKKNEARKEMIIYVAYEDPTKVNSHQAAQLPLLYSQGAAGGQIPTWELVEAYPMKDGKDISESAGYDPTMFWKNRDPRFYSTIVYNGAVYGVGSTYRRLWLFEEIAGDPFYAFNHGCSTGFYCRKGIDTTYVKGSTTKPFQNQAMDWAIIRYPEILLDLAECANQLDAHRSEAKALIIPIRQRAGIEAGDGSYGLASGVGIDKTATLKAILKERQIEFAYEGKRFLDLRRLRMYSELNNLGQLHAMGPRLNKDGVLALNLPGINENSDISDIVVALTEYLKPGSGHDADAVIKQVTNYTKEAIDVSGEGTISLSDKYYFYPIPPDLLLQNPELKQNKDWDNGTFEPTIQ